jgi:hypothetical protein
MGTTVVPGRGTHAEIDREIMRAWTRKDGTVVTNTDCHLTRTAHYHIRRENGEPKVIMVTDIDRMPEAGTWLYKEMSEDMNPYYYDCPLKLLDICPLPNVEGQALEWAKQWRESVRQFHARQEQIKNIRAGHIIELNSGDLGVVTRFVGLRKKTIVAAFKDKGSDEFKEYRVPPSMIRRVL